MSAAESLHEERSKPRNPFKFLDYYKESDRAIFAGRNEEIAEIVASFSVGRTYVIYGRSGLGKTSLIKAGLFPRMVAEGYHPLYLRILDNPVTELCQIVADATGRESVTPDELPTLLAGNRTETGFKPFVLVLDQFEEFFIRFDAKQELRTNFADLLGRIARQEGTSVQIIFSLREDYLANLDELHERLPDLGKRGYRLMPLTGYGARQAILTALHDARVPYESGVVTKLVGKLEAVSYNPLVLQIYCAEVYRKAAERDPENIRLTVEDVEHVGEISDIYMHALSRVIESQPLDKRLLICCALDVLKTADLTKRALRADDLCREPSNEDRRTARLAFNATLEDSRWVLEHLTGSALVRRLPTEEPWYELLHDGIVRVIDDWLRDNEDFRRFRDASRLIDNLRGTSTFLAAVQLQKLIDPFERLLRLTSEEVGFVFRSSVLDTTESVKNWAARFDAAHGPDASVEEVLRLLGDLEYRHSATKAARAIGSPRFVPACIDIALNDRRADVRRSAGEAVAAIGGEIDMTKIKAAMKHRSTRGLALDLLADLDARQLDLKAFGSWTRARVRRILERRRIRQNADLIAARTTLGAINGAIGGLVFALTVLLTVTYLGASIVWPETISSPTDTLGLVAIVAGIGVALAAPGAWIGRRAASAVARRLAIDARGSWRGAKIVEVDVVCFFIAFWAQNQLPILKRLEQMADDPTRYVADLLPPAFLIAFATLTALQRRKQSGTRPILPWWTPIPVVGLVVAGLLTASLTTKFELPVAAFLGVLLAWFLTPIGTSIVQRCLPDAPSAGSIILASALGGLSLGVVPLLVLAVVLVKMPFFLDLHLFVDIFFGLIFAAVLVAVRVPITSYALAWAEKLHPPAEYPDRDPKKISRTRDLLAAPLFLAAIFFFYTEGPDCTPLAVQSIKPGDGKLFKSNFPATWPDAHYVRINNDKVVATLLEQSGPGKVYVGGSLVSDVVVFAKGSVVAAVANEMGASEPSKTSIRFTPRMRSSGNLKSAFGPHDQKPVLLSAAMPCVNGDYSAVWHGTIPDAYSEGDVLIVHPFAMIAPTGLVGVTNYDYDRRFSIQRDAVRRLITPQPVNGASTEATVDIARRTWELPITIKNTRSDLATCGESDPKINVLAVVRLQR